VDAKTRRLLKVKQPQQAVQDISIATVANRQSEKEIATPKVWVTSLTLPASAGLIVTIPSLIALESILSIQMMVNVKTADANWYYISVPSDAVTSGLNIVLTVKLADRGLYASPLGSALQSKAAKLTIFYK
jgi:hypothetical protein